jgi:hypothetical protein
VDNIEKKTFTRANRGSKLNELLIDENVNLDKNDFWGSNEVKEIFVEERNDENFEYEGKILFFF